LFFVSFEITLVSIMKRALAERAKQSGLPNGVSTPSLPLIQEKSLPLEIPGKNLTPQSSSVQQCSSTNDTNGHTSTLENSAKEELSQAPSFLLQQNLAKMVIPNIAENLETSSSTSEKEPMRSPRPSPSPRPKKRLRESFSEAFKQLQEEDEDNSSASAFYLRHQNRALASELRSVKYQLSRLERERDFRRTQCSEATQSINALRSIWGQLESSLGKGRGLVSSDPPSNIVLISENTPLSTGSGTSVEMIDALITSLGQLGETSRSRTREEEDADQENNLLSDGDHTIEMVDHPAVKLCDEAAESKQEKKVHNDLFKLTENIAERATLLQSWIWSLLQKVENVPVMNGEVVRPLAAIELQDKITRLEVENTTLQQKIEEVARSRDEMTESDRRVRRALYRLAAGRVQLKEVLKAIAFGDEDKESTTVWMEAGSQPFSGPPLTQSVSSASVVNNTYEKNQSDDDKEASASSNEVAQLKRQVAELNEVAAAREDHVKQV
jgi:hypothetical protein